MSKKRIALLTFMPGFIVSAFYVVYRFLIPATLDPGEYKTSIADYGSVVTSVPASGKTPNFD
jgi:hypothetical protein